MVKKKEIFLLLFLLSLGIFFIYIYNYIQQSQEEIFSKIERNKLKNIEYIFKNIENNIVRDNNITDSKELVKLFSDNEIRQEYEKHLSLLLTPTIKYLYLLYKDDKDRFRFLLDASKIDKANFYQKFDVTDEKYKKLYETSSVQIIKQKNMENLFLTYLYPIKSNGNVIAILSVDLTTKIQHIILELISPLETFFIMLIIFIFLFIILLVVQVFYYFMTRKRIFTDPLTQLYNRNYLQEIIPSLQLENYSLAMLDLDRFKNINDTYGHKTGDFILAQSSKIFKKSIGNNDILIRYGGEEFLLFIYKDETNISSLQVCESIIENISSHLFQFDNNDIKMQVSIGIHENPVLEKNMNEAIKVADKMLYIAKSEGRNRVVSFDEKLRTIVHSKDINYVKQALAENRVVCYYQPIFDYKTNKIYKYEALVRIIDSDGSIISPFEFLPGLKHTNIHYKLTQRILSLVLDKFKNSTKSVSINLNFSDLINNDIENSIVTALKENRDLASRVSFEILESDEITDIKLFKKKIHLIHSLGSKISIDDFGSGYANFRTILDIEANYLKIDGSLIKNIDTNEKDFKVVKSIINFANEANMKTIAEFVHSKEVYNKLLTVDVDFLQGYYISEPRSEVVEEEKLFKI